MNNSTKEEVRSAIVDAVQNLTVIEAETLLRSIASQLVDASQRVLIKTVEPFLESS